jgi:anti-sigma factor RsiW
LTVAEKMTCKELVELVTEYLEGSLTRSDRRRFEKHLDACDGCTTYVEQMQQVISTLGRLTEDAIQPEATARLLHAFRDWKAA